MVGESRMRREEVSRVEVEERMAMKRRSWVVDRR